MTLTGSIGAKGESSQTILLQSSFCGRVYVQISRFTLLDYLGLLPMKARVKADARLTILPDLYPMEADMTARPAYADDGASNRRGEDRSEVYQLREYRPGDDIRQIHWKLSSKLDELILKEASQPESRSLLVFWDKRTGGNPQQMDALAEVVSSAGMALLQSGVPYTLCWTDRDDLQVQDISEENQLLQAIPALVKTRAALSTACPKLTVTAEFSVSAQRRKNSCSRTDGCISSSVPKNSTPVRPPLPRRIIPRPCSDWRFNPSCEKMKTDSSGLSPKRHRKSCTFPGALGWSVPF